jgi:hypothetical protein
MSRCPMALLCAFTLLIFSLLMEANAAMIVTSDAPGNIFVTGKPVAFQVSADPATPVPFRVVSYWDQVMRAGTVAAAPPGGRLEVPPLPPGWYRLELGVDPVTPVAFGVVLDRGSAPLDVEGRVCVDSAAGWLCKPAQWRPLAKMVRLAGIPWVRERLTWGEVNPARGKYAWGRYDTVADAYKAEGVHLYQISHDSPAWAAEKRPGSRNVADLRDAYVYTKAAAEHFKGRIEAWEVWNEADIGFWPDLGDRFAGIQKSFYLGYKAGNPQLQVLQVSFCRGVCRFDENLLEQGVASYYDIFNWHIYAPPASYPGALAKYIELLDKHKVADRPIWLSEAGIHLNGTEGDGKSLLNPDQQRLQCQFVAPSVLMSLLAGTDKHFVFVLPHYLENGVQFGLLKPDLTPYPGFVALSACANIIGRGDYLGQYILPEKSVEARAFSTPQGLVMALWSPQPAAVSIPTTKARVTVADVFGHGEPTAPVDGKLTVKTGPETTYLIGLGDELREKLIGTPRPRGVLPVTRPAKVVIVGRTDLPGDKARNTYTVKIGESFDYAVDVYNFDEKTEARGQVALRLPAGWKADHNGEKLTLKAMDRQSLRFRITPQNASLAMVSLRCEGRFPGNPVGAAVSDFSVDLASIPPTAELPLDLKTTAWKVGISGNGTAEQSQGPNGEYVLKARFDRPGDRWCYSTCTFDGVKDFSKFDAVSFEVRCSRDDDKSVVRFMVGEPNAARYYTEGGVHATADWQRVTFAFKDMGWGAFSPPDPDGKLDLDKVSHIEVGFNTPGNDLTMEVRNLRLVALK